MNWRKNLSGPAVDRMWWHALLPVYGLGIRMRFTGTSRPAIFHQAALSAWLRSVLGSPEDYRLYLCSDVPESGRCRFVAGEVYRFTVFGTGQRGRDYLARLPDAIRRFQPGHDKAMPFRDNWRLEVVEHWNTARPLPDKLTAEHAEHVPLALDANMLSDETAFWRRQTGSVRMHFVSPWRVLRAKEKRGRGKKRYCYNASDLSTDNLWLVRVDDSLRRLAEDLGAGEQPRLSGRSADASPDLFWVDAEYRDHQHRAQEMGGLLGEIVIRNIAGLSDEALALLVIGQHLGIGQRRVFGNGRYRLPDAEGRARVARFTAADQFAGKPENMLPEEHQALLHEATSSALPQRLPETIAPYGKHGQILIVCGEPARLFSGGGRARIERDGECLMDSPWRYLDGIVLFGRHNITMPAMLDALANDVPIHLASGFGKYRGMVVNPDCAGNGELWLKQQQLFASDEHCMQGARSVVDARIRHMRETLRRREDDGCKALVMSMKGCLRDVEHCLRREQLNGVEGYATRCYFEALRLLVPASYAFAGRNRHPPADPFNALLSLGYTYLYAHTDTLLRAEGLLPERGFYHRERSGHAALASDLMEPFRHVVERCALSMVQRGKLRVEDFIREDGHGCRLSATARRMYLAALSEAMRVPLKSVNSGESIPLLDHMHSQVQAVKRWVTGASDSFEAWRMR